MSSAPELRVAGLYVYPIKSCRAIAVPSARIGPRGLELGPIGDRRWMLADADGHMITQRQRPALARVRVAIEGKRLTLSADRLETISSGSRDGRRSAPGRDPARPAGVGHVAPAAVNDWFSRFLGEPARLIYQKDTDIRPCDPNYAVAPTVDRVGFADAFPYLLTGDATLLHLNRQLPAALPMDRFRPNIVVTGAAAEAEYGWRSLAVGDDARLSLVKPCTRCGVTTIDQQSGAKTGIEPLATLARDHTLTIGGERGAVFGENGIATHFGMVHVGDPVTVLEQHPPHPFHRRQQHGANGDTP